MVVQEACVRIVEEDVLMRNGRGRGKIRGSLWRSGSINCMGVVCLGVNKASVGEVSDSHYISQVGSTRFALS